MPRDYGKIRHRFWTGPTGKEIRRLGLETRVVASYLLTCGSSNMIGLYYLPMELVAHETGIPFEGASNALRNLEEIGFAYYDESSEIVFVPHMAREQIGEELSINDRQRLGVIALLKEQEKSSYYGEFLRIYRECFHLEELADRQESVAFEAPSRPLRGPFEAHSKSGEQEIRRTGDQENSVPAEKKTKPKRIPKSTGSEAFEKFWSTYPAHRHVEKAEAIKSWPGDEVAPAIMEALSWQTKSHDWTKDGGSFVPHPKRYLSKRRWEDERPRQESLIAFGRNPAVGNISASAEHPIVTGRLKLP